MIMKPIFAWLMVLFFIFSFIVPTFAQNALPTAEDIVSKMQSKLNLTQDQLNAVTPIIEKYASKREELHQSMEDGTADKSSMRSQMKQLRADERQELSQVLSEDQMSQWNGMQGQQRHKNKSDNAGGAWGAGETHPEGNNGDGAQAAGE